MQKHYCFVYKNKDTRKLKLLILRNSLLNESKLILKCNYTIKCHDEEQRFAVQYTSANELLERHYIYM